MPKSNPTISENNGADAAADLVRSKLDAIYSEEPDALEEEKEISKTGAHSVHQKFMLELMSSDKSTEAIQEAWHAYYQGLDNENKRIVWQEFYEQESKVKELPAQAAVTATVEKPDLSHTISNDEPATTMADLHKTLLNKVNADGKLKPSHHIKSVVFALAFASVVTGALFFVTNNERFITPFIQPSANAAAAPIITDGSPVGPEAKIIIPKINLEAPLVTDVSENSEAAIQSGLEKGVTLYPETGKPGEVGNPTFFGHSSNNLFNKGLYKFVFVRLHTLDVGDTYAINYNGKQYVYKIFSRDIVNPDRVDILYEQPRSVMSTLITCEPPGTSNTRLVLRGEQISPDPSTNTAPVVTAAETPRPTQIPSNAPSLLSRLLGL